MRSVTATMLVLHEMMRVMVILLVTTGRLHPL
jgi:hypothetical protein